MRNFVYNIPDDVKSSGTDLKESLYTFLLFNILDDVKSSRTDFRLSSCTFLSLNTLDDMKSSGTNFKRTIMHAFISKYTRYGEKIAE